ncbi:hypothetical protein A4A49_12988 [Nicotiana attenuata]|uniref:Uncharacterized protein n=1 Tax=Nicotiana attenuata TaxID=49451 RepID=A0A314KX01_NICAT|nr:hypothetical protein A4A49_12988 [Nicotiana attenuata]
MPKQGTISNHITLIIIDQKDIRQRLENTTFHEPNYQKDGFLDLHILTGSPKDARKFQAQVQRLDATTDAS